MNAILKNKWLWAIIAIIVLIFAYSLSQPGIKFWPEVLSSVKTGGNFQAISIGAMPPSSGGETGVMRDSIEVMREPYYGGNEGKRTAESDVKVIKTADLALEVADIVKSLDEARSIAKKRNGFVVSSSYAETPNGRKSAWAQVKVPFSDFDAAIADFKALSVFVERETTSAQDVTEEYIDLQAQLKNMQAEEQQYQAILKQATKIEDILNVTQRLSDVRGRIEQLQGRINYLDNRTDYSLINIQLSEEALVTAPTREWRPWTLIKEQAQLLIVAWQQFVSNVIGFVFWLIGIIPYLVIIAIVAWIARAIVKRRGQKPPQ